MAKLTIYPYINKMKKQILVTGVFAFFLSISAMASHIVGGEFELIHVEGETYRLNLIIYFDDVNGHPGAEDPSAQPYIFRKSDNVLMDSVLLLNQGSTFVPYSNPACATGELVTRRIVYAAEITLPEDRYNEPEGYYIVWERCCRNNTIDNVVQITNDTVGQSFYLEFCLATKSGTPIVNSSPVLFPPLSDYACIGQPYVADFAGTDADGDSLVYSLATPLNSSSIVALPVPSPNNPDLDDRPLVPWVEGISVNNMVPGTPPLKISKQGVLSVTPSMAGLFVFAVKVEEYRNGNKIGEVRRDFQMLVLDCPPSGNKPELIIKVPGNSTFNASADTLTFNRDQEKCFTFHVTDKDGGEKIKLAAIPVNFSANVQDIFVRNEGLIEDSKDTLKLDVCLPECPLKGQEPFVIDFVATDNSCPQPLTDTLRLVIRVESPENALPVLSSTNASFAGQKDVIEAIGFAGDLFLLSLQGDDIDGDALRLHMFPAGMDTANFDISFTTLSSEPGKIVSVMEWDLACEDFDFSDSADNNYTFRFLLRDQHKCIDGSSDTLTLKIKVQDIIDTHDTFLPPNAFSPNGDGINDYFDLSEKKGGGPAFVLPPDNCRYQFSGVSIYNRWGKLMYQSNSREFRWYGENAPPGTYYYQIKYTNGLDHSGTLTLLR